MNTHNYKKKTFSSIYKKKHLEKCLDFVFNLIPHNAHAHNKNLKKKYPTCNQHRQH